MELQVQEVVIKSVIASIITIATRTNATIATMTNAVE
jgi:hypothetical protein